MSMKTFDEITAKIALGNVAQNSNATRRLNAIPVDESTVYGSYAAAKEYALSGSIAYAGQVIAVTEDGVQNVYVLDPSATDGLRKLASGGDASSIERKINALSNELLSSDGVIDTLSTTIETEIANLSSELLSADGILDTLSTTVETNMTVTLSSEDGTGDVLKKYTIKQGGEVVGEINIPKDYLVKKAEIKTCATDDDPVAGLKVGDKYIDFTVNTKDGTGTGTESHLYIPFKDLAQLYTAVDSETIDITITEDNKISADVKTGSIGAEHLTDGLSTVIKTVVERETADRGVIETLSGDENTEGSVAKALKDAKDYTDEVSAALSAALTGDVDVEKQRAESAEANLLSAINSKVFINGVSAETLKVVNIDQATYHDMVVAGTLDPNTVYVVSADNYNMYGGKIVGLADGTEISDAVNYGQLCAVSSVLDQKITTAVQSGVQELSTKVFGADGLSSELRTAIDNEITARSEEIKNISVALSTDYYKQVSAEASARKADDKVLSDAIVVLNGDEETTGSVAKALKDAKDYTDTVSTALSTDYVKKISEATSSSTNALCAISVELSTDYVKKIGEEATARDNAICAVSVALSTDYVQKIAESSKSGTDALCAISVALSTDYVQKISTAKSEVIGEATDTKDADTVNGAKAFATDAVNTMGSVLSGTASDLSDATTINGAKAYADAKTADAKAYTDEQVKALSDELYTGANGLSAKLHTEVTTLSSDLSNTVKADYVKYTDVVGGKDVITETNKIVTQADIAAITGVMHFKGVKTALPEGDELSSYEKGDVVLVETKEYVLDVTEVEGEAPVKSWHELGDESLYVGAERYNSDLSALRARDAYISAQVDVNTANINTMSNTWKPAVELSVDSISAYVKGLENATDADISALSSAIDGKVTIDGVQSDLSVQHIGADKYHELVKGGGALSNVVYIVSSDTINAYGEKIENLAPGTVSSDAATYGQLTSLGGTTLEEAKDYTDEVSAALSSDYVQKIENAPYVSAITLNDLAFTVADHAATLTVDEINCGGANA